PPASSAAAGVPPPADRGRNPPVRNSAAVPDRIAVTVQRRPLPGPFDGLFEAVDLQDGVARELFAGRREGPTQHLRLAVAEHDAAAFAGRPQTVAEQEYPGLDHAVVV